jgi:hypothetical protein
MEATSIFSNISQALVSQFSDQRVSRELNEQLFDGLPLGSSISVELEGLGKFEIPSNCQHQVCSVALQHSLIPTYENEVKVICAVGGVVREGHGIVEPKYCFAVLRYNQDGMLYTFDLYASQFYY